MDSQSTAAPPALDTLRCRAEALIAWDALERVCRELGSGRGLAHDGDRSDAIEQLRAAQELIRGVGQRLRQEVVV